MNESKVIEFVFSSHFSVKLLVMRLSYFICLFSALAEASDTSAPRPFGVKSSLTHSDNTAKHRSHNHNLLDIPRGGALPAKEANLVAPSPIKVLGSGEGILKSITRGGGPLGYLLALFKDDKRRQPYLISLILSLVYLYFFLKNKEVDCLSYSDGFCVTNFVDGKCPHSGNSHLWSFQEDVIFTIIGIALPFTKYGNKDNTTANRIAIPGIIIAHGTLHWVFSSQNCAPANIDSMTTLYSIFVVALTSIMFLVFSNLIENGTQIPMIIAMIAAISFAIIKLTLSSVDSGKAIAAFFMATQVLFSYMGAFHPGPTATKLTGQTFIVPVIVSLTEYLKCDFLASVGGHFWYDFFLHISMLCSLLPVE